MDCIDTDFLLPINNWILIGFTFQALHEVFALTRNELGLRRSGNNENFLISSIVRDIVNDMAFDRREDSETVHGFIHAIKIPKSNIVVPTPCGHPTSILLNWNTGDRLGMTLQIGFTTYWQPHIPVSLNYRIIIQFDICWYCLMLRNRVIILHFYLLLKFSC